MTIERKFEEIDKIISLLQEWKDDILMIGNETSCSDDILRLAKKKLVAFIKEDMTTESKIITVDFDGTLCKNKWPEIGEPNTKLIEHLIMMQSMYEIRLILWTCRVGEMLDNAIAWCLEQGLKFDAVNENLPDIVEKFGSDTRKIFANQYINDQNFWYSSPEKILYICDEEQCKECSNKEE